MIFRLHVGQCTPERLAGNLDLSEHEAAAHLADLVAAGLVRERPDPASPDETLYGLDPAGLGALNQAWKAVMRQAAPRPSHPAVDGRLVALRKLPLFTSLDDGDLATLACRMRVRIYSPGEIVFLEGQECQGLYLVESGVIRIFTQSHGAEPGVSREQTLRVMAAGDSFNEVPVFDDGPNPASAQAMEESQVLLLPKDAVRQMLRANPTFAEAVLGLFAGRLRHMVAMVADLSFRHVAGRVAKILLQSIQPNPGVGAGAGRATRLTQQEMAEMAGTAREVVARALKEFERQGAIAIDHGRVTILDRARLETLA